MNAVATAPARRERWRRACRGLRPELIAILLLALVAVAGATWLARSAEAHEAATRARRVETQRLERRLRRLDASGAEVTLARLAESRDALRVALVEALDVARAKAAVETLEHHVEERAMDGGDDVATLRLTFDGRFAHGAAVLELLAAVEAARGPWPGETRGCRMQRAGSSLLVDCTVDILHWSDLHAPSVE